MSTKILPNFESLVEDLGVPGIAAMVLLPVFLPVLTSVTRPIAKAAIKNGILLYEKSKGVIAEVGETLEDIIAEAKAELAEELIETEVEAVETSIS